MKNRLTSDSGNSVSLFPFLAVLLCTMGALLVLLVVLADRAGKRAVAEAEAALQQPAVAPAIYQKELGQDAKEAAEEAEEAEKEAVELARQLEKVHDYQKHLAKLQQHGDQRLQEAKERLSHLESHTRRMEHELARLSLAAEQLKATEANQSVDQEQAERELTRLQQLIVDTEAELEELREDSLGKHSYAIVPYRGPNGTYRKPIYIECRKEAIILHPEGVRFMRSDFLATSWPGNPLAAALRATREHVNAQAAKAGAAEPPDPYPMILVRPDGINQYSLVRAAITSWDASFGYEFIDSDWKLDFPEGPDPLLAGKQQHAIMQARERLARRIRSAPSRFRGVGLVGTASGASGGTQGSNGYGNGQSEGEFSNEVGLGEGTSEGNGYAAGQSTTTSPREAGETVQNTNQNTETQYGATNSATNSATGGDASATTATEATGEYATDSDASLGDRYTQTAGTATENSSATGPGGQSGNGSQCESCSTSGGSPSSTSSSSSSATQTSSIADSQGRNWAVKSGGRSSVPIRRPIQVVVRQNQIALLPSRHALDGEAATGKVISLDQPVNQISNEFRNALRTHIEEWGLAGSGLYWRPMLKLHVGPGAEQTAEQVIRLMKNSGVEVSLPETARSTTAGGRNAPR